MAISSDDKLITLEGLDRFKEKMEDYVDENATTIFTYAFDVDEDGNLIVIYPDGTTAPEGFSISSDGYLEYDDGKSE